jgi:membrane protease subunit HflK
MPDPNDPGWKGWLLRFAMKNVLWLALFLVAVLAVAGNIYTIPSDSRGIVLRFGAIAGVEGPGLHVKFPFADEVYVIPAERKQSLEFGFRAGGGPRGEALNSSRFPGDRPIAGEKLMLTKDNKLIEVEWVMHYHIGAPEEYVFNLPGSGAEKEKILRDLCMAAMRRIFAGVFFDEGLTSGKQRIQEAAFASLQSTFDELKAGIRIDEVLLQETNVSEAIKDEYNSVTTAEEQVKTMIYQAEAHANKVIPEAEGRASVLVNEGEAYKFKRVSEAQGEAARLNLLQEAYKLNPELTRLNMWAEGMTEVWKKLKVVFVEGLSDAGDSAGAASGVLKVLPLPPEALYRLGGMKEGN